MDSEGKVKLLIPQGEYAVTVQSDDHDFRQAKLTFNGGPHEVEIKGTPNPFRKLKGQPAPELKILDAMGVSKNVSLKDYRGKHVLLEFWGHWCGPCVESSLPGLIQLRKENPGLESKLVILAVHENAGGHRTMDEIRKRLPSLESRFWGGKLPFPILLEKENSLTKTFGIRAYPTAVLIDPEGKVVDRADAETLKQTLGLR
jgi:thiol-disulfide isomerase/thioredoxin